MGCRRRCKFCVQYYTETCDVVGNEDDYSQLTKKAAKFIIERGFVEDHKMPQLRRILPRLWK